MAVLPPRKPLPCWWAAFLLAAAAIWCHASLPPFKTSSHCVPPGPYYHPTHPPAPPRPASPHARLLLQVNDSLHLVVHDRTLSRHKLLPLLRAAVEEAGVDLRRRRRRRRRGQQSSLRLCCCKDTQHSPASPLLPQNEPAETGRAEGGGKRVWHCRPPPFKQTCGLTSVLQSLPAATKQAQADRAVAAGWPARPPRPPRFSRIQARRCS